MSKTKVYKRFKTRASLKSCYDLSIFFYYNPTEQKKKISHLTNITPNKFCVYHYIFVNILYTQSSNPGIISCKSITIYGVKYKFVQSSQRRNMELSAYSRRFT